MRLETGPGLPSVGEYLKHRVFGSHTVRLTRKYLANYELE
jgi:hypothetical protein